MVTDEKIFNVVLMKYRLGILLVWLGVLTWLPFIIFRIAGEKPWLFWYLPFHLLGVISGSRLRAVARKELDIPLEKKNLWQIFGHAMIFVGILAWTPYFYMKLVLQRPAEVMNYLPYHLTGVLGGITLLVISYFVSRKNGVKV